LLSIAESNPLRSDPTRPVAGSGSALAAPIYGPHGSVFAYLGITLLEKDSLGTHTKLLRALFDQTALAVTERLFRMAYREYWIVAAQPCDSPVGAVLFAVDHERRLRGADHSGRQFLEAKGCSIESRSGLSALFKLDRGLFREEHDTVKRLFGCEDGLPYSALITPPDRSPLQSYYQDRMIVHSRPRLDMLGEQEFKPSPAGEVPGMAPWLLRRIQQHINTHLDSPLRVKELAASVGLSSSYFTRSFSNMVGTSPHHYVVLRRVRRAQQLLAETDLLLTEIALTTGFADQSHFCRRFRQLVGLAPSEFRQRHR
jgi:AraC-like DNA-binding protein